MKIFDISYKILQDFLIPLERHKEAFNEINFVSGKEMQTSFGTKNKIQECIQKYLQDYFAKHKLVLDNIWAQKYFNGRHSAHVHHNAHTSFVWYVQAENDCSKIIFYNPGWPYVDTHRFEVQPYTGTLLLFNSSIPHEVLPNGNQTRNIIAGNLKWLK